MFRIILIHRGMRITRSIKEKAICGRDDWSAGETRQK